MQDNRNANHGCLSDGRGTVCIDTKKVYDSCRDRDCFEDVRVFLTESAVGVLSQASSIRTKSARIVAANVTVNDIPYNNGFYQVTVRYFIEVVAEGCIGVGKSQIFCGIAALEKNVVLFGGESSVLTFSSHPDEGYCDMNVVGCSQNPTAIVETVEPIILGTKVVDCGCSDSREYADIPECVCNCYNECIVTDYDGPRLYVSFGLFSVIRLVRDAQLLVNATDYSVPDKECSPTCNNDNPCSLFRTMPFPITQFKPSSISDIPQNIGGKGNCGCQKN